MGPPVKQAVHELHHSAELGQIWITNSSTVEWYRENTCFRRFKFTEKVILAGFTRWESNQESLVIVIKNYIQVYFLDDGDSHTIKLPFPIAKAFFYANGLLLELLYQPDLVDGDLMLLEHKFITLSDPLVPFGSMSFVTNHADIDQYTMLYFPERETYDIAVLYNESKNFIGFYSAEVLNSKSTIGPDPSSLFMKRKKSYGNLVSAEPVPLTSSAQRKRTTELNIGSPITSSSSAVNGNNLASTGLTNTLRRRLTMNRRTASATVSVEQNKLTNTPRASTHGNPTANKGPPLRSTSATLDRMTISNSAFNVQSQLGVNNQSNETVQPVLSKDGVLTKITSSPIPFKFSESVKIVSTRFNDKVSIAVYDRERDWGRLWLFNLNSSLVGSMKFKAFGYSPVSLVKSIDIRQMMLVDICAYDPKYLPGVFALLLDDNITLFNPVLNTMSPAFPLNNDHKFQNIFAISPTELFLEKGTVTIPPATYPRSQTVQKYFEAIRYLVPLKIFSYLLSIWQLMRMLVVDLETENYDIKAFEYAIMSFLVTPESSLYDTIIEKAQSHQLFLQCNTILEWLPKIVICLHLLREEFQLNVLQCMHVKQLDELLGKLTTLMGWPEVWVEYYGSRDKAIKPIQVDFTHPLDEPPSIFKSLYSVTQSSLMEIVPFITFSRLAEHQKTTIDAIVTPRTHKLLKLFESLQSRPHLANNLLERLNELNITQGEFETYPIGVYAPLKRFLHELEPTINKVDPHMNMSLITRSDLNSCIALMKGESPRDIKDLPNIQSRKQFDFKVKDIAELTGAILDLRKGTETPLSPHPLENFDRKENFFFDQSLFDEVLSMFTYSNPHKAYFPSLNGEYTKILKLKKYAATTSAYKALTSGLGKAAVFYCSEDAINSKKSQRDELNLNFKFPSDGSKLSLSKDKFQDEFLKWAEFHRGVARGIAISKSVTNVTSSWINHNRPPWLDAQYGGFLLGLGLNGHLKVLEEWQLYNFLSPKYTHISIGLLLGICASMKGSMDLTLTKVLSVHIVALLPPGSSNLNIHHRVQTSGLIGVGLLYQSSQHRRMSDLLYSQITSFVTINEEQVPDEGYRLAAGIALGLVNMGAGNKCFSLKNNADIDEDMTDYTGDQQTPSSAMFSIKHTTGYMDSSIIEGLLKLVTTVHDVEESWMPDNSQLGATVSLMLMFLRSNCSIVADKLSATSDDTKRGETWYIKPELFMYREWASNMVMWDNVQGNLQWIISVLDDKVETRAIDSDVLPTYYIIAGRVLSVGIKFASSNSIELRDGLFAILDQFLPLYQYAMGSTVDEQLMYKGISMLINVLIISLSLIMCGSGDVETFKRIRYLHNVVHGKGSYLYEIPEEAPPLVRDNAVTIEGEQNGRVIDPLLHVEEITNPTNNATVDEESESEGANQTHHPRDNENHYGKYMATNLSLGLLFLGLGRYSIKTTDIDSLSYLIISVLPTFMPPYYLQETKYLWCMSVDTRVLILRDADTDELCEDIQLEITVKEPKLKKGSQTTVHECTSPCLLPPLDTIQSIKIEDPAYYPLVMEFSETFTAENCFKKECAIYVKKRDDIDENVDPALDPLEYMNNVKKELYRRLSERDVAENDTEVKKNDNLAQNLLSKLALQDSTRLELEDAVSNHTTLLQDHSFNLDMICSSEDTDYQLELWRRRHGL
ncbi:HBR506Cp [Eremothecium sinecaudum]|uniref:HBR506Cp n=1 Tax=Eremothecium sinecaudum TaxID=45286 RepID=A0A109UY20_9SACH|nr:HBR506Cp [Eremothecium sinecaudum]AMD19407.1 HBR506Cp [Eremothecium sinecaudum]